MYSRNAGARRFGARFNLIVFCMLSTVALLSSHAAAQFPPGGSMPAGPTSFAMLAEAVSPHVVNISATRVEKGRSIHPFLGPDSPFGQFFGEDFYEKFFGQLPESERRTNALGSGVIINEQGLILTNSHVIEKAEDIKIKTNAGKEYDANIIGQDPKTDLALIKVEPAEGFPPPAPLGNSDAIQVGDWVMAVGNPFGLGNTVTSGIISAKGRIIGAGPYDDFLQTDAAINPGNSGGPLYNMRGEVVGISTAIVAEANGIGFAIPINVAKALLPQLEKGKVIRGYLGVSIQNITPELAKGLNLELEKGVLVADVIEGGPADNAGVQRGDVIVSLQGQSIEDIHELTRMVANLPPGTKAKVEVIRNGKTQTIPVELGTMPQEQPQTAQQEPEQEKGPWGLTVADLTPSLAEKFGHPSDEAGVVIVDIAAGSPAAESQLEIGDLIIEVNRRQIANVEEFKEAVAKAGASMVLLINHEGRTLYVPLTREDEN